MSTALQRLHVSMSDFHWVNGLTESQWQLSVEGNLSGCPSSAGLAYTKKEHIRVFDQHLAKV